MKNLLTKRVSLQSASRAESALNKFTVGEAALFYFLMMIMIGSGLLILSKVNDALSVTVPAEGGRIVEGTVGSPRFINPLLAISDADRDLTALTFSGLLRATPSGELVPDLAEKYSISEDGLTYTVTIKTDAVFHDGKPITADDVIFTVSKAKDPSIKSPKRAEWEGVTTEKISDNVVAFHLSRPYYPFIENLTLGIIPRHVWKEVSSDEFVWSLKNISPIGSGPYRIYRIDKNDQGIPSAYQLRSFSEYVNGQPFIRDIGIKIYSNGSEMIAAWKAGDIDNMGGISPEMTGELKASGARIEQLNLPRVYGIFFNQNQAPVFVDKYVRQALDVAIDKNLLVENVLRGYGAALQGPLPNEIIEGSEKVILAASTTPIYATSTNRIEAARKLLLKGGWKLNKETDLFEKTDKKTKKTETLSFQLYAPNVPELKEAANLAIETWKTLGVSVELKLFDISDLSQNVIRPRKYDALLFGEVIGRNPDLFAFWHSSQRNDPGYNIALYTNSKVDQMLNDARQAKTSDKQADIIENIFDEINKDTPAVFLYTPDYLYVIRKDVKGFESGSIATPSERFANIKNWFIENERVWNIFVQSN
ncbi:MAG: hypothetical protein HYV68_00120 [Candidatus Taylorbacteria bacterium]|nr:hypothetical protein [Candidatus Taylorbacteria bacterium]